MKTEISSLNELLGLSLSIDVVDIGANPIDGQPPYRKLLAAKTARLVGFEPNAGALERLNAAKGPQETYLSYAVGDGARRTLRICRAEGMTSLFEPNAEMLKYFHGFDEWGEVIDELIVDTIRLDDVPEVSAMDYLKIDIQGGELLVFQNAPRRLADCLVIHSEVEFLPIYVDQPLFADVEIFLRSQGFVFHKFEGNSPRTRAVKPMLVNNNIYKGLGQVFDADAIFIRDFTKLDRLSDAHLLRMAMILHDIYGSFDVVLRLLIEHDRRTSSRLAARYMGAEVPLDQFD